MIHVTRMGQLVHQQVIEYGRWLEHRTDVQTDHAAARTRTPPRALPPYLHGAEPKLVPLGKLRQSTRQRARCVTAQPTAQHGTPTLPIAKSLQGQQTLAKYEAAWSTGTRRQMHPPLFAERRQIHHRRWKWLRRPQVRPTGALALDPAPMPLDERQHDRHRDAVWHNNLDAPIGMHARSEAPRPRTSPQRPRLLRCCGITPIETRRTPVHVHDDSPMR